MGLGRKAAPLTLAGLAACPTAVCRLPHRSAAAHRTLGVSRHGKQLQGQTQTSLTASEICILLPAEVYFLSDGPPVQWRSFLTQLIETQGLKPPTATIPVWLAWIIAVILENLPFLHYSMRPAGVSEMRLTRQMLSLTGMQVIGLPLIVFECSGCQRARPASCWRCLLFSLRDAGRVPAC